MSMIDRTDVRNTMKQEMDADAPSPVPQNSTTIRDDDFATVVGLKREPEYPLIRLPKKPRDNRLRECFTITPLEGGGGERISCNHCSDYNKTLQKFNPTKGRSHLTDHCPGVDDELRQILLETTQAAKKSLGGSSDTGAAFARAAPSVVVGAVGSPAAAAVASSKSRKIKTRNRPSPAYISFHMTGDDSSLNVTAPIENEVLVLRLSFPTDQLKLNFIAEKNMEGAALCIDGFMNMHPDSPWAASLYSTTNEGTRGGPHCRWSMSADAFGAGGMTRVQKVEQLLKIMIMI